jgi:hypothetical protein
MEANASAEVVSGSLPRGCVAAGLAVGVVEPDGVLGLDIALEVNRSVADVALTTAEKTSARSVVLELTDGGKGFLVVAVKEHHPVEGLARQAEELSSGSERRHLEHRGPGAQVCVACRRGKARAGNRVSVGGRFDY